MKLNFKAKEVRLVFILLLVILSVKFKDNYYLPKKKLIQSLTDANLALNQNVKSIVFEQPNVPLKEKEINHLKETLKISDAKFKKIAAQIPNKGQLDRFLYFLTVNEFSEGITFDSIKPNKKRPSKKTRKEQKTPTVLTGYEENEYTVQISGSYSDVYNYINYLEHLSEFASISKLLLSQNFEKKSNKIEAKIVLLILISNYRGKTSEAGFKLLSSSEKQQMHSPFFKFSSNQDQKDTDIMSPETPDLKLSGIISAGNKHRVIIKENIYQEGQSIDNLLIKKIEKDKIIVEASGTKYEIPL